MRAAVALLLLATPVAAAPLQAVVTTRVVHPGQTVEAADLRIVDVRNPRPVARPVVRELADVVGLTATRTLLPRRYIAVASLRKPHAVRAGERAVLRFRRANLSIMLPVTVLADAAIGDRVDVRPTGSTRSIRVSVSGKGTVVVR
ncbi:flagellar basal body P-ring formation chaperone FlgA [Rhizobiaceae bacterium]|nr:flagellar basal body P-ring formation chaperone FlgA [Rhizobiaceae bacterium]